MLSKTFHSLQGERFIRYGVSNLQAACLVSFGSYGVLNLQLIYEVKVNSSFNFIILIINIRYISNVNSRLKTGD